uniref:Integrin alpha-7 n=1 Tax=Chelydra serpentina TaxID=8475 RepID=A0A8C3SJ57_CHESE
MGRGLSKPLPLQAFDSLAVWFSKGGMGRGVVPSTQIPQHIWPLCHQTPGGHGSAAGPGLAAPFGHAVTLHPQMLVGAPQALALPGQRANRTGGLYACPLTQESDDCWLDLHKESKENQWLGVSVKSQGAGGKIVTCAHLYESRNRVEQPLETRYVIGRCYVLSQDLTVSEELDGGEWKFCEGRAQGHDHFGFCQQGVSVGFTADNHYILFGAPGTYNWKGEPPRGTRAGDGVGENGGIPSSHSIFVTGAPRANHTGAVVILRRDNVNRLVPEAVLPGEQLTSSFGYAVAVLDLNSDGWMDLVVGAPHFFDRQEEIGGAAYVYINQAGRWAGARPVRLSGPSRSMFGIGLAALGDLNQDGFQGEGPRSGAGGDPRASLAGSDLGSQCRPLGGSPCGYGMGGCSQPGCSAGLRGPELPLQGGRDPTGGTPPCGKYPALGRGTALALGGPDPPFWPAPAITRAPPPPPPRYRRGSPVRWGRQGLYLPWQQPGHRHQTGPGERARVVHRGRGGGCH